MVHRCAQYLRVYSKELYEGKKTLSSDVGDDNIGGQGLIKKTIEIKLGKEWRSFQ